MLKPFLPVHGPSTSYSVRDGLLPVHPPVLGLPATLRASTLMTKMRCNELVKRPSNDVSLSLTTPAASLSSCPPRGASSDRTALRDRPAAMARSWTPVTERARHEARQEGNLNPGGGEGTWGTVMGPEQVWGPGLGKLADHATRFPRHPNLACKMRPRHAARVTRPSGRDTDGHPAETPRDKSAAVSTTIKGQRKKKSRQKRDKQRQKVKYRTGREGGTLVYSPRLVLVTDPGPGRLGRDRNR